MVVLEAGESACAAASGQRHWSSGQKNTKKEQGDRAPLKRSAPGREETPHSWPVGKSKRSDPTPGGGLSVRVGTQGGEASTGESTGDGVGRQSGAESKISSRLRSAQAAGIRREQAEGAPLGDSRCGRRRRVVWSDTEDDGGGERAALVGGVAVSGARRMGFKASAARGQGGLNTLRGARNKSARQVEGAAAAARGGGEASTSSTARLERG